jgi:AcrR family transcriptional regulator
MGLRETNQAAVAEEVISEPPKVRVRDRIIRTARELFYRQGIRAVGVDTITNEAGTNKMSFYRSFPSKDELVAEYLRDQEREGWEWWDEIIASHKGDARAQIEALFGELVSKACACESRGCALANAAVEITEEDHPARAVVEGYKKEMRRRFRSLAEGTGAADAAALGDALMLLWEGSYLTRLTFDASKGPNRRVAEAALKLVDAYAAAPKAATVLDKKKRARAS